MERIATFVYDGGLYRFDELEELLDDAGAYVLRREDSAVSTVAIIAVAEEDKALVEAKVREIGGTLRQAVLAGSEIAVVAPSPSGKHLPHPTCDISEFLRRAGAQTILISLARGVGQEPILEIDEARLINECDLAVVVLGDCRYCLQRKKSAILQGLQVPVVVTGGPSLSKIPHAQGYVSGFGRKVTRVKSSQDIKNLARLVAVVEAYLAKQKDRLYSNLPQLSLPALKQAIEQQIPEIGQVLSPSPITVKIDGLRVKLPFDEFHEPISSVRFMDSHLRDFAVVLRSVLKDYSLVKLKPLSPP